MSSTISPNMNLIIPGVGTETGPDWASDINASLTLIDQHNHSAGQGNQIQPNGLNINSDLTFQSNNATDLRTSRYTSQSASLTLPTDIGCLYVVGNELYYNDVTGGNRVAITANGTVNAGSGSISGLPSGTASATFSAGTFVWQSATSTAAVMDARSYILRNSAANSKGLTLNPPLAMAADYALTLPSLPASQYFMTVDASGNMAAYAPVANGITRSNQAAVGQQISAGSDNFNTGSASFVDVTNLSVTITTTGRPVIVMLITDPTYDSGCLITSSSGGVFNLRILRGASVIYLTKLQITSATDMKIPSSSIITLDTPSAGTYTYKLQALASGTTGFVTASKLVAYEL